MKFKDQIARDLNNGIIPKGMNAGFARQAQRKIKILLSARSLNDLRSPPGNRLETLQGNRKGQYSIRINDRYRLCFQFNNSEASDIEFVDYH